MKVTIRKYLQPNPDFIIMKRKVIYLYHGTVRVYGLRSLYLLHGENILRRAICWFVDWP